MTRLIIFNQQKEIDKTKLTTRACPHIVAKPENVTSMFGTYMIDAETYIKTLKDDTPYPPKYEAYTPLQKMM